MGNRGAKTPTRRALSLQEHHWGSSALSLRITGDWAEHSSTLGFPTCTTRTHPCFACHCGHADIPWAVKDHDTYETACRRCGRWIKSADQHANVVARLAWRKQNSGPRGRALDADFPALGLKKHDRLEPWMGLQDIGDEFDQLQPTAARPVRVCFWRRSEETATRHRSPLLDTVLHTSV